MKMWFRTFRYLIRVRVSSWLILVIALLIEGLVISLAAQAVDRFFGFTGDVILTIVVLVLAWIYGGWLGNWLIRRQSK